MVRHPASETHSTFKPDLRFAEVMSFSCLYIGWRLSTKRRRSCSLTLRYVDMS